MFCPKDENTWRGYNQSLMNRTVCFHKNNFHLPEVVMVAINPIFQALSDSKLLEKRLKGKTQNPNESLNSVIWSPKIVFV